MWVKGNYDGAMRFVAYAELAIFARVVIGALTSVPLHHAENPLMEYRFRSSLIAPIFLAHFIRLRYHASAFTRQAVGTVTSRIDGFAGAQGGLVANAWGTVKRLIGTWGGASMMPTQPQAPPPAGAAGGGAGQGAGAGRGTGRAGAN